MFFERIGLRAVVLALAAVGCIIAGCGRSGPDRLLVATTWPKPDRDRLESEFQGWVAASHDHLGHRAVFLEWMPVASERTLIAAARRADPPEVLLGGSATTFTLLTAQNQLSPIDSAGSSLWCGARRPEARDEDRIPRSAPRGSADAGEGPNDEIAVDAESVATGNPGFKDPRSDPASLFWALNQLERGRWDEGFARLVQFAATQGRIARRPGPDFLIDRGGESGLTAAPGATADSSVHREGAAIPRSARNQDLAQGFLRFLVETNRAAPGAIAPEIRSAENPDFGSLAADLLGATLVDSQDELWSAWRSLASLDDSRQARDWLVEPPPWPPASVARYLGREGDKAMSLIETLAGELAPDPSVRSWLIRSWLSPRRPVDDKLLSDLARAAGGRLCREPGFRAWLREEWTASARQRYRRVARWAAARKDSAPR